MPRMTTLDEKARLNQATEKLGEGASLTRRPTNSEAEALIGLYFPILDHGFVSLVDYMGTDECIERAARVSYGGGSSRKKTDRRGLIRYLHRMRHTTPSEMLEVKLHCCMPIFVARQWIRHRTANVNEQSGRYSLIPTVFYEPALEDVQRQSKDNKQGRSGPVDQATYDEAVRRWRAGRERAAADYEWLAAEDVARELARIDLPLSTYTQWYWKIDLHNLLHFLTLRVDSHAQKEIRDYGQAIAGMLARIAPLSYEAWIDYDVAGVRLSRQELKVIRTFAMVRGRTVYGTDTTACWTDEDMGNLGMSSREIDEIVAKLSGADGVPSFDLDLSKGLPASHFAEKFGIKDEG